jgi:hypothetical protein
VAGTAKQLIHLLGFLKFPTVFLSTGESESTNADENVKWCLSTDASQDEVNELTARLQVDGSDVRVERFLNESLSDGASAIVDQVT